jgi:hypothetical protein
LPAYRLTGIINLPAGCRRSQRQLCQFPSARILAASAEAVSTFVRFCKGKSRSISFQTQIFHRSQRRKRSHESHPQISQITLITAGSAGILPAYRLTGIINLPAGCRRSQQQLRQFPSARILATSAEAVSTFVPFCKSKRLKLESISVGRAACPALR